MSAGLQQWWIGLSRRERIATSAAAALVVIALVYLVAIEPAWRTRERLAAELPRLRSQAAEVESLRLEAKNLKDHGLRLDSPAQAKAAVGKLLQDRQLAGAQLRETDDGALVLSMRGADVAVWLATLREMTSELPLRIAQARLARTAPGVVDAEATLAPVGQKWQ